MLKTKKLLLNILTVFIALIFSFFIIEFSLQLFYPQQLNPDILENHETYRFVLKSNYSGVHYYPGQYKVTYETNSIGLRNPEIGLKNSLRILSLGDSFTFGHGVEFDETFSYHIQEMATKETEVINAGIFGWNTDQEYLFLKNKLPKINPDIIVLGFYIGNDITANNNDPVTKEINTKLVPVKVNYPDVKLRKITNFIPFYTTLKEKSHFFSLVRFSLWGVISSSRHKKVDVFEKYAHYDNSIDASEVYDKTFLLLKEMDDLVRQNDAQLLVLVIPDKRQIDSSSEFYDDTFTFDPLYPNKLLTSYLNKENIKYIDTTTTLQKLSKEHQLYYTQDQHLTPLGHYVVAKLVNDTLVDSSFYS